MNKVIEGDGKAILYTGDVRCEPWFVNTLTRNPILIEYTSGLKTLDRLYLDTSFIEDFPFQTKAEGIAELLRKVSRYPQDTVFHIQAWTFGYEDVWVALSKALNSPVSMLPSAAILNWKNIPSPLTYIRSMSMNTSFEYITLSDHAHLIGGKGLTRI